MRRPLPLTASLLAIFFIAGLAAQAGEVKEERRLYEPSSTHLVEVETLTKTPIDAFKPDIFTVSEGRTIPYRLLSPSKHGQAKSPLVVALHASGAVGTDNVSQVGPLIRSWAIPKIADDFPAYVVAPQFPTRSANYSGEGSNRVAHAGEHLADVLALVEDLKRRLPIDPQRVYLVGFSMGASAAMLAAATKPKAFAGVVAFSGVPPRRSLAAKAAKVPFLLVHGTKDKENPYAASRSWASALAKAGNSPTFVTYEGMDHRLSPDQFLALGWRTWLFNQRRGS
ncbi:Alpha/beta hydrolase family protein [Bosea sp. OK403]|uniref:carboxylesterase family protein n=1 Tax=Bosea sp. OK403 TaxID=1855286 RepID=UPI0008F35C73|nr:alpha/beta fold hydrolase [Bosea sp. OK403]SFJ30557.1 Alpha/beta hydrolase family protein [Bosea sp. OK403]